MIENKEIMDAIRLLGVDCFSLSGHPTNETEFLSMYKEMSGVDSVGSAIMSADKSKFSVTWSEVSTKVKEIKDAQPLKDLREVRNSILAQSDWIVIKEREEGGSVSNFADWKKYRQELRDITKTYKSLEDVKWPTAPSE